jgi:hypothetical protein
MLPSSSLAGQAFATMLDLKTVPEALDFAGPTGAFARRQPLARFTKLFGRTVLAEVVAETPENVSYINAEKLTRWPDFVAAGTWVVDGDYLQHLWLGGLASDLRAEGANGSTDKALGRAVAGTTKLNLPFLGAKDNLKFALQYGDGYGAQLKSGPDDAAFNLVSSELKTIGVFSTYTGLQHWWSDAFRSNLVFGYVNAKNPAFSTGMYWRTPPTSPLIFSGTPGKTSLSAVSTFGGAARTRTVRLGPTTGSFFPPGLITETANYHFQKEKIKDKNSLFRVKSISK